MKTGRTVEASYESGEEEGGDTKAPMPNFFINRSPQLESEKYNIDYRIIESI